MLSGSIGFRESLGFRNMEVRIPLEARRRLFSSEKTSDLVYGSLALPAEGRRGLRGRHRFGDVSHKQLAESKAVAVKSRGIPE